MDNNIVFGVSPAFVRVRVLHRAAERRIFGLEMIEELRRHGYTFSPVTLNPIFHSMEEAWRESVACAMQIDHLCASEMLTAMNLQTLSQTGTAIGSELGGDDRRQRKQQAQGQAVQHHQRRTSLNGEKTSPRGSGAQERSAQCTPPGIFFLKYFSYSFLI